MSYEPKPDDLAAIARAQLTGRRIKQARRSIGSMFVVDFRLTGPGDRFPWAFVVECAEWTIVGERQQTSYLDSQNEIDAALAQLVGRSIARLTMTPSGDLKFDFDGGLRLQVPARSPEELAEGPAWYFVWFGMFSFGADMPGRFTFEPATEPAALSA